MKTIEACDVCTNPSDNKKFQCPPRMSDGRHFTNYHPRCANLRNAFMIQDGADYKFPPQNSYDFRQYLIHNGSKIMDINREESFQRNMCGPCSINPSTLLPEQTVIKCNENVCKVSLNDKNGLGQGRDYDDYAKVDHKEKQRLNSAYASTSIYDERNMVQKDAQGKKNCCTNYIDDANLYPLDGKIDTFSRLTIPGGGNPLNISDR